MELSSIYHDSQACLVLSLTNASLLPLELLAAGCVPVMNDGENNRLVIGENSDIVYTLDSPIELAKGLDEVVSDLTLKQDANAFLRARKAHHGMRHMRSLRKLSCER